MRSLAALSACAMIALAGSARADVVRPPPKDCPEGHEPVSSHGGPYCRPPLPASCPPEHRPRVYRSLAYCEPPPEKPCPPGSYYASKSPTDTYCLADRVCKKDDDCPKGPCVDTTFCIRWDYPGGRHRVPIVAGACGDGGACPKDQECVEMKRCDRTDKRVASSPSAAEPVDPTAAPRPSSPAPPPGSGTADPGSPATPAAPKSTGCAGCALTAAPTPAAAGALTLLLALLAARRRRGSGP